MANANLLTILVAASTGFLVGGLWYGPLFGKAWMEEHGCTEAQLRSGNMLKIYGLTFAFSVLSAIFLGHLLAFFDTNARSTLMISIGISLGYIIPDAGYRLVFYAAMGLVFLMLGH